MTIKICLFGGPGVGKTSIIQKSLGYPIPKVYDPDIGYGATQIQIGEKIYDVWDCAGCEPMDEIHAWTRDLDLAIVVTDPQASVQPWLGSLQNLFPKIPLIICMNKADTIKGIPLIETDIPFVLISAKHDLDLHPFWKLIQKLLIENLSPLYMASRHNFKDDQSEKA